MPFAQPLPRKRPQEGPRGSRAYFPRPPRQVRSVDRVVGRPSVANAIQGLCRRLRGLRGLVKDDVEDLGDHRTGKAGVHALALDALDDQSQHMQ